MCRVMIGTQVRLDLKSQMTQTLNRYVCKRLWNASRKVMLNTNIRRCLGDSLRRKDGDLYRGSSFLYRKDYEDPWVHLRISSLVPKPEVIVLPGWSRRVDVRLTQTANYGRFVELSTVMHRCCTLVIFTNIGSWWPRSYQLPFRDVSKVYTRWGWNMHDIQ